MLEEIGPDNESMPTANINQTVFAGSVVSFVSKKQCSIVEEK
jgi:hypothetical protein